MPYSVMCQESFDSKPAVYDTWDSLEAAISRLRNLKGYFPEKAWWVTDGKETWGTFLNEHLKYENASEAETLPQATPPQ
jgi:hypothetical protein